MCVEALCVSNRLLPELQCVLLEAMRVLPPAYMVGRCASEDTTLTVASGATFALPQGVVLITVYPCAYPQLAQSCDTPFQ